MAPMMLSFLRRVIVIGAFVAYILWAGCEVPVEVPEIAALQFAPVFICSTEGLIHPGVGIQEVYQTPPVFSLDTDDPAAGQATGFFLTVATTTPHELSVVLTDVASKSSFNCTKVDPPAAGGQITVDTIPQALSDSVRQVLASGQGVFWLAESDTPAANLEHRMAVVVPETLLKQYTRLEVFTSVTPDGFPLGADRLYLAKGFFYMVTLGESVAVGNGLPDEDKFAHLVADVIEQETHLKVIHQMLAASAADIMPEEDDGICGIDCYREAPLVKTSIAVQVDQIERPDLIELVLLTGCINDVEVLTIIDPETDQEELAELTSSACRDEMTTLLKKIRAITPQAYVVVTGYYPILSEASYLPAGLEVWVASLEMEIQEDISAWLESAVANFSIFLEAAHPGLAAAVDAVNAESLGNAGPMVAFVDPEFGPENALFAPESWLWGLTKELPNVDDLELDLELFPEDPRFSERISVCFNNVGADPSLSCLYASLAHPNRTGSQVYADAIVAALRQLGVLAKDSEPRP